jgi:hypothetical protein
MRHEAKDIALRITYASDIVPRSIGIVKGFSVCEGTVGFHEPEDQLIILI